MTAKRRPPGSRGSSRPVTQRTRRALRRLRLPEWSPLTRTAGPAEHRPSREERIASYLREQEVPRLQIGAGPKHLDGWLSTDLHPRDDDTIFLDATKRFPFPDDSLAFVFGEHLIEHVSWWAGQRLLAECRRVLRPGGVLRLATPEVSRLIDLYRGDAGAEGDHYLDWHHDRFTPRMRRHPLVVLNHNMRAWGHTFLYDAELLDAALCDAGFEQVEQQEVGCSSHPELRGVEQHHRGGGSAKNRAVRFETMCVEATAPSEPSGTAEPE